MKIVPFSKSPITLAGAAAEVPYPGFFQAFGKIAVNDGFLGSTQILVALGRTTYQYAEVAEDPLSDTTECKVIKTLVPSSAAYTITGGGYIAP